MEDPSFAKGTGKGDTHLKIKDIVKQIIYKLLFKDNSRKTHVGHL